MSAAYYNEHDPYAAQWLRNLIAAGLIAPGDVDDRSIEDVDATDVAGYGQCHFFAGVGVWSYALRLAGVPDDFPIWTGSCPCQPFSHAGGLAGFADSRHLWPHFARLIRELRPAIVAGEQVASRHAEAWLDAVCADVEGMGFAFGAVAFPAAGVGAPHIRDRTYWAARRLDDADCARLEGHSGGHSPARGLAPALRPAPATGEPVPLADGGRREVNGFWRAADWLRCRDGKWRAVQAGTFPLADGIAGRVGRLRAYGNAVCAEQARAFIEALLHE